MKHRGVLIQKVKEEIPGSSLKELKDGRFVECKPQFDTTYQFARSFPYSTLEECKQAIDNIFYDPEKGDLAVDPNWFYAYLLYKVVALAKIDALEIINSPLKVHSNYSIAEAKKLLQL